MANFDEIANRLYQVAVKTEETHDSYLEVLTSEGEIDVTLSDGKKTPNLNKRVGVELSGKAEKTDLVDSKINTWSGRTQESKNKEYVSVDDFNNLLAAFQSDYAVNLGNKSKTIPTGEINLSLTKNLNIENIDVVLKATATSKTVINIECNGFDVYIKNLKIDADRKAFTGLYISNTSTTPSKIYLDRPEIKNCYRQSNMFADGDGIFCIGKFSKVDIISPSIDGVIMAAGAGVQSVYGVCGITVVRKASASVRLTPEHVLISNPDIRNVKSEDLSYTHDQDAIRIFTLHSQPEILPTETSATILGGYIKNCLGRAVKSQGEIVLVDGITVYRDESFTRGYGNIEFDFQVGGGKVQNAKCIYKNTFPSSLAYVYCSENTTKNIGTHIGSIDGIDVSVSYDAPYVHAGNLLTTRTDIGGNYSMVDLSGIRVRANNFKVENLLNISRLTDAATNVTVKLSDSVVPLSASFVTVLNSYAGKNLSVILDNVVNSSGTDVPFTLSAIENFAKTSFNNVYGIVKANIGDAALPATFINGQKEYGELPVIGDRRGGGSVRLGKARLVIGANTIQLGGYGGLANTNLLLININKTRNSTALLAIDKNGINIIYAGSEISNGSNAPSVTPALFDIWTTDGKTLNINNTYSTAFCTYQIIG